MWVVYDVDTALSGDVIVGRGWQAVSFFEDEGKVLLDTFSKAHGFFAMLA